MNRYLTVLGAVAMLLFSAALAEASVPRKVFGEEFGASW